MLPRHRMRDLVSAARIKDPNIALDSEEFGHTTNTNRAVCFFLNTSVAINRGAIFGVMRD
jgi:hypothetical protein